MLQARDTIFSVGWDISATVDLVPGGAADGAPTRLDELLPWLVRRQPTLRCYILTWDYAVLYTLERDPWTRWRLGWRMPSRVHFGFDDHHPFGASHHQKIIVVDDALAFSGGVDLTGHRWDTAAHRVDEPHRLNANGTPYGPYHEIQAMADGPVAAALGALVRDRWDALGQRTRPLASRSAPDLWPEDVTPDLTDVDVAIARTMPASERNAAIRECERSYLDSIAAATHSIYIENQYFTNDALARALAHRLEEADGPEVIVVMPKECEGWIEKQTMGVLRHEALAVLVEADRHRRLRLVYPVASRARDVATFVHSKVMVVDDRLLRIGSANMSHRSMGVDSECDLIADAGDDPGRRAGVQRTRDRLLGEQLGLPPEVVTAEISRLGSMGALDRRAGRCRPHVAARRHDPAGRSTDGCGQGGGGSRRTSRPQRRDRGAAAAGRTCCRQRHPRAPGGLRHHRGTTGCRTPAVRKRRHRRRVRATAVAVGVLDRPRHRAGRAPRARPARAAGRSRRRGVRNGRRRRRRSRRRVDRRGGWLRRRARAGSEQAHVMDEPSGLPLDASARRARRRRRGGAAADVDRERRVGQSRDAERRAFPSGHT